MPGAQHRAPTVVDQQDVAQLETQRMRGAVPGDLHRAHAGVSPLRGGRQPALGHRPKGVGGDMALRQPPGGEAGEQDHPRRDSQEGRRDMSDGWSQQAGNPLPRTLARHAPRLCDLAQCPP